ncbi:MAG: putative photosynthetic complex assembly protein PuhE [Hyphomicrobiales bacterium]|nr:putative photosynthetic complex assembly protein PuhE [Hyphomicrobiales bacterium]
MLGYVAPVGFALFLWWFSTGVVILLDGLPRRTFRWSMLGASVTALLGLAAAYAFRAETTALAAYVGFAAGLLIWAWHEMSFLMGYVTGPRRTPCPPGARGWRRFAYASETVIHHELAIAATAAALAAAIWGAPNQAALWTFVALWVMRLSAKLNVFLGVPNLTDEFMPERLHYLKSYFAVKPMNLLFPLSVTGATGASAILFTLSYGASPFEQAMFALIGALLALAALEHWFMVLPVRDAALWRWALAMRARLKNQPPTPKSQLFVQTAKA